MKKSIMVLISFVISIMITIVTFEAMSWYHFGDDITRIVLIRMLAYFCALFGISICICALLIKKSKTKKEY